MYSHFIKINVCIDSIFSQSCYITVQKKENIRQSY